MPYPTFAAGQTLTAGHLAALQWQEVFQSTDVSVNNSTAYVNTNLSFTAAANARYRYELYVGYSGLAAANVKFDWTEATGGDVTRFLWGPGLGGTGAANDITTVTMRRIQGGTDSQAGNSGGSRSYTEIGYIDAGDGGTFTFKFAQNTATVGDTTVAGQSVLFYQRIE